MGHTRVSRHIRADPETVYGALLDPVAIARWKVPDGMTSEVHELEPRVGGRFRISLTYDAGSAETGKSSARTDTYRGHFLDLVPGALVIETVVFETAREDMRGEMTIRTTLRPTATGTTVEIDHEGLPRGVSEDDNRTGTEMALAKLAAMLEGEQAAV